jgi:hypothetical protein
MKLALITPRYGGEIATGAEYACRLLAEQLSLRHDVEVLTTTARDKRTWKNEYAEGADRIRGVLVRRFAVNQPHESQAFQHFSDRILNVPRSRAEEMEWVRRLGPSAPGLVEHLKRQQRSYDALIFFSLIHWTTVHGIAVAPERSVLFPCLRPWSRPSLRSVAGIDRVGKSDWPRVRRRTEASPLIHRRLAAA